MVVIVAASAVAMGLGAQAPVHAWMLLSRDTSTVGQTPRGKVEFYFDTLNIERAGPKRETWLREIVTIYDSRSVPSVTTTDTRQMWNCATYQYRSAVGADVAWKDIPLDHTHPYRRVAKIICPKESQ